MIRSSFSAVARTLLLVALVGPGCKKDEPAADGGEPSTFGSSGRRGPPPRLRPVELDALPSAPGLLADGSIYVAVRADAAQSFLQHLPWPSCA